MRQKRVSLTQHLIEENRRYGTVPEELRLLLEVVARPAKPSAILLEKARWATFWAATKQKTFRVKSRKNWTF